ncbi:MAG: SRPBCC family protein [Pseudomonadales bacterium]
MAENDKQRGSARAPGPTVADVFATDKHAVPAPLLESSYEFIGDKDIPVSRYFSPEYFDLEMQKLWPKSWQWACREEHVPDVGDTYVYDVGVYSVIVVRSSEDSIQAFLNSCTHRGTRILAAEGSGYSAGFKCPFHGWSWKLDGQIDNIPGRWDFPHVCAENHNLQSVQCELWGGFVFINMDPDAPPFDEHIDCLKEHFSHFPLDRRRIKVHVEKTLPANWKAAQEAFLEAYHNIETHDAPNGANTQYDVFGKYLSRFIHNIGTYSIESLADYDSEKWGVTALSEQEQFASMVSFSGADRQLAEGETARSAVAEGMRSSFGDALGVDFSSVSDALMLDSIEYHLFPNMFIFPGVSIPMVYRFRPNGVDVDSCLFDVLILEPLADGDTHPEPPDVIKLSVEQSYTEAEEMAWLAPVYDQDTGNLQQQQQGFKTSRKPGITLGNYQEARIRRIHMTLDEFLGAEGGSISS